MQKLIFILILLTSLITSAQSGDDGNAPESNTWEFKSNFDLLFGLFNRTRADSSYNPDNLIFEVDRGGNRSDLNLDLKVMNESGYTFVARPRLYSQYQEIEFTSEDNPHSISRNRGKVDLTELFGEAWLTDTVSVTVGLQNYQWGPAETIGPSNPIFHFNREQRSLLWKEKGRVLARINYSPSPAWSFIFISEPVSNGEPNFTADREFKAKNLIKAELRSENESQNYVGATGGTEEEGKAFFGGYFNWMPLEGISFYSDFRMSNNGYGYLPQQNGFFVDMLPDDRFAEDSWHQLGVLGVRYEHEHFDLRLEGIFNSRGYDKEDFEKTFYTFHPLNPNALTNAERAQRPGLELIGKNYGYFSLRIPDVGEEKSWQLAVRYLVSGMDGSSIVTGSAERSLDDHIILVMEGRQALGDDDLEFTLQERTFGFLGIKILW